MSKFNTHLSYIENEVEKLLSDVRVDIDMKYCEEQK